MYPCGYLDGEYCNTEKQSCGTPTSYVPALLNVVLVLATHSPEEITNKN